MDAKVKIYKYENATVYIYGEVSKERLRNATVKLIKGVQKHKVNRKERN